MMRGNQGPEGAFCTFEPERGALERNVVVSIASAVASPLPRRGDSPNRATPIGVYPETIGSLPFNPCSWVLAN